MLIITVKAYRYNTKYVINHFICTVIIIQLLNHFLIAFFLKITNAFIRDK